MYKFTECCECLKRTVTGAGTCPLLIKQENGTCNMHAKFRSLEWDLTSREMGWNPSSHSSPYVCMYVNFYLKAHRKKNDASLISYKLVSMRGVGTHLNR